MRLRTRSCLKETGNQLLKPRRSSRLSLSSLRTPDIKSRLRSFNGFRTPAPRTARKKSFEIDTASNSSSGISDQENRESNSQSILPLDKSLRVELTPIYSPRRFQNINKDQAAKLKRLNTRKIEFDANEAVEVSALEPSLSLEESFLVG